MKAEKSKSFDIGYETFFEKIDTTFNISAFNITYKNPLEGWESNGWKVKNSNGEIRSKGVELSSLWRIKDNLNIGMDYNYNETYDGADCDDPDSDATTCIDSAMVRVPRHALSSAINYKTKSNINNKLLIKYSGETRDYGNGNNSFSDVILDDYITFNYSANYKLFGQYNLYFIANNIFDQNYEQAYQYSTMGRSFNFGLSRAY